jgi:hypothetical protein
MPKYILKIFPLYCMVTPFYDIILQTLAEVPSYTKFWAVTNKCVGWRIGCGCYLKALVGGGLRVESHRPPLLESGYNHMVEVLVAV